jgi:signal transduction histidine kinase
VAGNPIQSRQMLENLLNNAIKYTPEGGSIRLVGFEEDGQVILQVADTGPGIPTKEQRRIFDRFYRASNVSKSVQGTGLGLSIVKSIVDNHRGRIWVDSILGKGAVFTIVLPIEGKNSSKPA